jgi:elongation factor P hydroxylase
LINHTLPISEWERGVSQLLNCLNPWLAKHWQTQLVAVKDEPFYSPATEGQLFHQIQFAHGYFNSALHELAHWCVAGEKRRLLPDFGYWYEPDGRSAEQQRVFEQVEVKPQAIEWHFAQACCRRFKVSMDNLSGVPTDPKPFQQAVTHKAKELNHHGMNERTQFIIDLLCLEFGGEVSTFQFDMSDL